MVQAKILLLILLAGVFLIATDPCIGEQGVLISNDKLNDQEITEALAGMTADDLEVINDMDELENMDALDEEKNEVTQDINDDLDSERSSL